MYQCISVLLCRWVHAVCESLYTEDEVEQASDEGFACTSCTPYVPKPVGKSHSIVLNLRTQNRFRNIQRISVSCDNMIFFFCFAVPALCLFFTVVESAIMASIKIKEPGWWILLSHVFFHIPHSAWLSVCNLVRH